MRFPRKRSALFKWGQWHFHLDNAPVHNSILVTDYLSKMGIKTVPHPRYSPDLAPCDFYLLSKLRGCRYEKIEEMKEAMRKVNDTLTQEDCHGAFQWLLEQYNIYIYILHVCIYIYIYILYVCIYRYILSVYIYTCILHLYIYIYIYIYQWRL